MKKIIVGSKKLKGISVEVPPYRCKIDFFFGDEAKYFAKFIEYDSEAYAICSDRLSDLGRIGICCFTDKFKESDYPSIAHEILHACHFITNFYGLEYGECAEAQAYIMSYVLEEFQDQIKDEKKKKNKAKKAVKKVAKKKAKKKKRT